MIKIEGHGRPTKFKAAERGAVYTDLDTDRRYECLGKIGFVNSDAVDEPIEYHWKLIDTVKENQMPNGSGGGDLPFGEKTVMGDTLTWDGNDDGLVVGSQYQEGAYEDTYHEPFRRISEITPTFDEIVSNGYFVTTVNGEIFEFNKDDDMFSIISDNFSMFGDEWFFVAYEDNTTATWDGLVYTMPKKGIYTWVYEPEEPSMNLASLTINGYNGFPRTEIVPIPKKYLPEQLQFGEEIGWFAIVEKQTITLDGSGRGNCEVAHNIYGFIHSGDQCTVKFDGVSYDIIAYEDGDACLRTDFTTKSGVKVYMYDGTSITSSSELAGDHTIELGITSNVLTPIENKFLGIPVAPGTGQESVCLNKIKDNAASGDWSHAEGFSTEASGDCSHAEGEHTIASGDCSHAEGRYTTASGAWSHAEGKNTTASGDWSHAEGENTTARGAYQHVSGRYNIIEPPYTAVKTVLESNEVFCNNNNKSKIYACDGYTYDEVTGIYTLTPINYDSVFTSTDLNAYRNVYVIYGGESGSTMYYNTGVVLGYYGGANINVIKNSVKYTSRKTDKVSGKYAHIVGNGTNNNNRSNAHTLDWEGNAWYAGSVEGTAVILTSPNGTRFNVTVGDDGVLTATAITE